MKDLQASPTGCEEASTASHNFYIPCDQPATRVIKTNDAQPYRMCDICASHNIKNRGAKDLGPFLPGVTYDA